MLLYAFEMSQNSQSQLGYTCKVQVSIKYIGPVKTVLNLEHYLLYKGWNVSFNALSIN